MNIQALQFALEGNLGSRLTPELIIGLMHAAQQPVMTPINLEDIPREQYGDYTIPLFASPTFAEYSTVCLEVAKLQERIAMLEGTNSFRNNVIEEVAKAIDKFVFPFGTDTVASFSVYVRSMKS